MEAAQTFIQHFLRILETLPIIATLPGGNLRQEESQKPGVFLKGWQMVRNGLYFAVLFC